MEPHDFKKNLNIGIPHKEIPKWPKGKIKLIALLILLVLALVFAGGGIYFYKFASIENKCKVFKSLKIENQECVAKNAASSTFSLKEGEWISNPASYIPDVFYKKLPIDKGAQVEHLFVKMSENRFEALDRYESAKSADTIYNEYKKFSQEINYPIIFEEKMTGKQTITFGIAGQAAMTVEITKTSDAKKYSVNVYFDSVANGK